MFIKTEKEKIKKYSVLTEKEKMKKYSVFVEFNIILIEDLVKKIKYIKKKDLAEKIKYIKKKDLIEKIKRNIKETTDIRYEDIINLIIRKRCSGKYLDDIYNTVITWCVYKIKQNNVFVEF